MNRIYKVIWSRTKNCYVVVSELAKSHTRSSSRSGRRVAAVRVGSAILLGTYLAAGCSLPLAWADTPTQEEINEAVVELVEKTEGITREGTKTTIEQGFNVQTNFNSGSSNGYMNVNWGQDTLANGENATAWGKSTVARSPRSTAWGNEATAK
ncbi:ESPR domain-containing protein, partial [uncultured Anaerovibrio sp.]|uniref:ESPR domain-containing protein n=1 Tax=uncultured Anaerovibrio sp. TaxID=361586 RepID=UPI0025CC05DE